MLTARGEYATSCFHRETFPESQHANNYLAVPRMLCIQAEMSEGLFYGCLRVLSDPGETDWPPLPSGDSLSPWEQGTLSDSRVWKKEPGLPSSASWSSSGPIHPPRTTRPALLPATWSGHPTVPVTE